MKNKLDTTVLMVMLATIGFAQSNSPVTSLPVKGTLVQTGSAEKISNGDGTKSEASTVTEGKKGLNAVNVKTARQAESSANGQPVNPPQSGSAGNIPESKHAINTKGTGATKEGAAKQ